MISRTILTMCLAMVFGVSSSAQQHPSMPAGLSHEEHLRQLQKEQELKTRGAQAMGFDQDAAVHHFTLTQSGGTIAVEVRDSKDTKTLIPIREHLQEVAKQFAAGDFGAPAATHAELPPGAAEMHRLRGSLRYVYRQSEAGGRIEIATDDAEALAAVHAFLRYQIAEHRTGDPVTVKADKPDGSIDWSLLRSRR